MVPPDDSKVTLPDLKDARPKGRRCVFCGSSDNMSGEHVWSEWLAEYVPGVDHSTPWEASQSAAINGVSHSQRDIPHIPFTQKVRAVCVPCNTGWMSDLEGAAKPYLVPLLQGRDRDLHTSAQRLVAAWIYQRVLVLEQMQVGRCVVPDAHYQHHYKHRGPLTTKPPIYTTVWIGQYANGDCGGPEYRSHSLHVKDDSGSEVTRQAYSATFTIGYLAAQVTSVVDPVELDIDPIGHLPMIQRAWPTGEMFTFPPPVILTGQRMDRLADVYLDIAA